MFRRSALLLLTLAALGCTELKRGTRAPAVALPDALDAPMTGPDGGPPDQAPDAGGPDLAGAPEVLVPECTAKACSGATGDGCCPNGCTATTDSDCSGCGNGRLDDGETCDPPGSCPTSCPPAACMRITLQGSAAACTAKCASEPITTCTPGDNCCPSKENPTCNAGNDMDCASVCDNGVKEAGENCEPRTECARQASACVSDQNIERKSTGDVDDCTFLCTASERQCVGNDGFCPQRCDPRSDADCAGCGNGKLEPPEKCDPPGSCAALAAGCVSNDATVRTPSGRVEDCSFACSEAARACGPADGACPPGGCGADRDPDCRGCGNGRLEGDERCDPLAMCAAEQQRCVSDATTLRTPMGRVEDCSFFCLEAPRGCTPGDGVCSAGCTPATDPDCPGCGNGRLEGDEACDPPARCRRQAADCASDPNTVRMPTGDPDACTFRCVENARPCGPADLACPSAPSQCFNPPDPDCKRPPGSPCTPATANQCHSNLCVDNRCCRQACGPCHDCGPDGSCVPVSKRMDPPECNGANYCEAGACVAKKPNGAPCTNPSECQSGVCNPGNTCGPRADNQPCLVPADCSSGQCTPLYRDADADLVPSAMMVERRCGAAPTPPPGTQLRPKDGRFDCCDASALVKPGADFSEKSIAEVAPACASVMPAFDFDCDGMHTRQYTRTHPACPVPGPMPAWQGTQVPACGMMGTLLINGFAGCSALPNSTQGCR